MICSVCGRRSASVVCWQCLPGAPCDATTADLITDEIEPADLMWSEPTPEPEEERKCA